ncbi:Sir2 silent information regulator family NAD-dependent deacetylase [Schaalia hyovaginalis]|uniref:Sir2 silent information regulator family NAD-dependent deacetylase n=1 Tax=Schaalia hyovaginalis TaxID=29316 RepID=UPI002A7F2F64|nr:Sir2 silent information regulator family NAD-dependent deacetylase [Schaalia hyovaginalis]MDY3665873.1 Sir2 silent information regulator family NAD-dependent deacetylase [Schaalia hyovaginalis]MDY4491410.1 Sir2 silent information regulator family NAD-dependent deacetylase [Schaalia hyovaginalis]
MTAFDLSRAEDPSEKALALVDALDKADRVLVGAGSGLSASAGLTYSGPRFESAFPDFIDAFGLTDMYSAGFHPFPSPETKWAYWSRHVLLNRYEPGPLPAYRELLSLLEGRDFFVLTTNVDHQFPLAGFPEERLFATQGDYGRFQCSIPCRPETWGNESAIRSMAADQSGLAVPASSIPRCPWCGAEAMMHLRVDSRFVEDAPWHEAAARYRDFSARTGRTVYLELGVGMNTPGIIKYPFWQAVHTSPDAVFATLDSHPLVPAGIAERSIALPGDIATSIHELTRARQSA